MVRAFVSGNATRDEWLDGVIAAASRAGGLDAVMQEILDTTVTSSSPPEWAAKLRLEPSRHSPLLRRRRRSRPRYERLLCAPARLLH